MANPLNRAVRTPHRWEEVLRGYIEWIRGHQEQFWAMAGTLAAAVLLVFFMVSRRQEENEQAWIQLGPVQNDLQQGHYGEAAKALDAWTGRYQSADALFYAKFLRADLSYRTSDYAEAARVYGDLAQNGRPPEMRPLALSAETAAEEMAGRIPQAQASAQRFLDLYPDHFLAASMALSQARLAELTGPPGKASALYDRFVILYPQSPWTALARARVQALAGTPLTGPKKLSIIPPPTKKPVGKNINDD